MTKLNQEEYKFILRSKWLTPKVRSLDELVSSLDRVVKDLKEMQQSGVYLHRSSRPKEDWFCLATKDTEVAEHFGFLNSEDGEEVLEDVS